MRAFLVEKNIPRVLATRALVGRWPGVLWTPLSHARMVDLQELEKPDGRWLNVVNQQCGVCATDLSTLFIDRVDLSVSTLALPGNDFRYLGHEVVSEVDEVGPDVSRFKVGDRVVMGTRFDGANCITQEIEPRCLHCAERNVRLCENAALGLGARGVGGGWGDGYSALEDELWPVPETLDNDQASLVEPMAVALHGVLRRPPAPGDHVLVIGAGILGLLTTQMVKIVQPDCHLTVSARYAHQAEAARRLGADEVIMDGDLYWEMARVTDAHYYTAPMNRGMLLGGFEVIYDCVGSARSVEDALRWARASGTVVLVGISLGQLSIDLNPIWYQEVDLVGSRTFGPEDWNGRRTHTFDLVIEMLEEGVLNHERLITHRFPFEEYKEAIRTARDKTTGAIKVTFDY